MLLYFPEARGSYTVRDYVHIQGLVPCDIYGLLNLMKLYQYDKNSNILLCALVPFFMPSTS